VPASADLIDAIVARVTAGSAEAGRTRLVSIDGPAGSGKTSLAEKVAESLALAGLDVAVLHMDDFYEGWDGLRPELEPRLVDQVLDPLAHERAARWQRYDWGAERFGEWVDLPVCDVVVLEGCGSGARAYDAYRTLLVWLEAGRDLRIERGIARDGEGVREHWMAWMETEQRHFDLNETRERADVLMRTG
jgi:uridine kinase